MFDPIDIVTQVFLSHQNENKFRLSQVQGFQYGDDYVVRDCWLDWDKQEIWRKKRSDCASDEMKSVIEHYTTKLSMEYALETLRIINIKSS